MNANNRLILVALALATFTCPSVARTDELADIQQELADWRASIASIEIKYTVTKVQQIIDGVDTLEGKSFVTKGEWTWTDQGKWRNYSVTYKDGKVEWRRIYGSDGHTSFSANFEQGESEYNSPDKVEFSSHSTRLGLVLHPLEGLWHGNFGVWLPELMRQQKFEYKGIDEIGGIKVVCVEFQKMENVGERLWLDPHRSFLPVRTRMARTDNGPKGHRSTTITEFTRDSNALVFPKAGDFLQEDDNSRTQVNWVIDEIQWNKPVEPSKFIPPLGESTIVIRGGKMSVHGGPAAREKLIERLRGKATANRGESQFPPGMEPPKPTVWWYSMIVCIASASLLAVALGLRLRQAK